MLGDRVTVLVTVSCVSVTQLIAQQVHLEYGWSSESIKVLMNKEVEVQRGRNLPMGTVTEQN